MSKLDARSRRAITQRTGARVVSLHEGGHGEVTGHYDDDIVYVLWDGEDKPVAHYTEDLRLEEG